MALPPLFPRLLSEGNRAAGIELSEIENPAAADDESHLTTPLP